MSPRFLFVIGLVVTGFCALLWSQNQAEQLKVSGILEADEIRIGSRVGGRVKSVHIEEGQRVAEGALLVELEPFDLREQLAQAEAELAAATAAHQKVVHGYRVEEIERSVALRDQAKAQLDEAQAGPRKQEVQEAVDKLELAQAEQQLTEQTLQRTEALFTQKSAAREDYDRALSEARAARAKSAVAQSQLNMLKEGTRQEQIAQAKAHFAASAADLKLRKAGFRKEEIDEAEARRAAAQATVDAIKQRLGELKLTAPSPSTVEAVELQPGDLIAANAPVVSLMDNRRMWIRAYVPQRYLEYVPLDRKLKVVVDAVGDRAFTGRVAFVARQGEFTPSNVQTPEERGKQVFRIKVELEDADETLHPGMSADVFLEADLGSSTAKNRGPR